MRNATLIVLAAMVASACSDAPSRMTSPPPSTVNLHPYRTVIGSDGNPTPGSSDRVLVDTRTSLQQSSSLSAAWALFPGNDHSPSSASSGTGWAFAKNFDGQGTRALRADWQADGGCAGNTVRVITSLPTPKPKQLFVQWRQYLGRGPNDAGGRGAVDSFTITNPACATGGREELRVLRAGVKGGATAQITHSWASPSPSSSAAPRIETRAGVLTGNQGWSFTPEQNTGRPVTITVYMQAVSSSGAADGVVQVWIDGKLFLAAANQALGAQAFDRFELPSFFAGAPQNQSEYFWDVVAWQPVAGGTSSVSIAPATATIDSGKTVQLTATTLDASGNPVTGQSVSWVSQNTSVATVNGSGLVTGVAAGTAKITATSNGATASATVTVKAVTSTTPPPPTAVGCANPQPGWLWCDDFEADHSSGYFEVTNPSNSFVRTPGVGLNGSTGMRATWAAGQVDAGSLKLAFGRNPSSYMKPVDAGTANYREIYWRVYVKSQAGWKPNGNDKFSRAIVVAKSDWSEAAIGHMWGGGDASSQNNYVLDPASGVDANGNVVTVGYNDFAHLKFLGAQQGQVPVFGSGAGQWYCVEAHMRLNDSGKSNGVLESWINGTQDARATGLNFVGTYSAYGINALFLENYINSGAPQKQVRDYDDLVVSTQRVGCEDSSQPTSPASVASVTVSLNPSSLAARGSSQATATLTDSAGNVLTGRSITWTSSNTSVATVKSSGTSTATVTAVAAGTATITATSGGVNGRATMTVTTAAPPPPPPSGIPAPTASSTIIQDTRAALQKATTADQAFAIFGQVDHTPYRGARNTGGWSFTTNADGNGLHAFRADWEASTSNNQEIRIIDYLPDPKPTEMYVQWKSRVGRYAFDTDGNGSANSYAVWPQSNACKRALFSQESNNRLDYTLQRSNPEVPRIENGANNFAIDGDPSIWNFNQEVGATPYTTTVYLKVATSNTSKDGVYKLWIDGTLVFDVHNLPADATAFDRWEFPTVCTVVPQPQSDYYWDILIWKP